MIDDQWRSLLAGTAGALDLPPGPLTVDGAPGGPVTAVTPPGVLDGRTLAWPPRLTTYGQDSPAWE